jgi:hypothetical protein
MLKSPFSSSKNVHSEVPRQEGVAYLLSISAAAFSSALSTARPGCFRTMLAGETVDFIAFGTFWAHSRNEKQVRDRRIVGGIVGVAPPIVAIESAAIIPVQGQAARNAVGQVRIRNEVATEGDQAGITAGDASFGRFGVEPTGGDNWSPEELAPPAPRPVPAVPRLSHRPSLAAR